MLEQIFLNSVPILLAGLGVLATELAGVLNIGIEGLMVWGAFLSLGTAVLSGSPLLGILVAVLGGALGGALLAFVHLRYRVNVFIAGLSLNLFAWGLVPILSSLILGVKGVFNLQQMGVSLPTLRLVLQGVYVFALLLLPLFWYLYKWNRHGTVYRAIHSRASAVHDLGIRIESYKTWALLISGALAGLAGAVLAYRLGAYVPNISAGRGWISLVVVFLGNYHPVGIAVSSLLFSSAEYFAAQAQEGFPLPGLLIGLPYFLTLAALVLWALVKRKRAGGDSRARTRKKG